jgi:hypothetical protein
MSDAVAPPSAQGSPPEQVLARALPNLRSVPGCPTGSEQAILQMSLPPYYTACPNPFVAQWLGQRGGPERGAEEHRPDPGPFTADVSEGKGHAVYKAHAFHTKVPHQAIMRYILHYTEPGDLVLDGFCGSGSTGVAAQACGEPDPELRGLIQQEMDGVRWGARRAFLQDLSPAATFIAAGLNLPVDATAFDRRSREILAAFDAQWGWMYETTHTDGRPAKIDYTVWSEVFTCRFCGSEVVFYDCAFDEKTGRVRDVFSCPACGAAINKDALDRRRAPTRTLAGDTIERVSFRPVRIAYRVGGRPAQKKPDDADLAVLERVSRITLPLCPTTAFPLDDMYHGSRLGPKGFTSVHHLYSDRALAALSILWSTCSAEPDPSLRMALLFWVEQALWGLSWMNRYQPIQQGRMGGSQVNRQMTGVYYVPSLSSECSVRYNLEGSSPARGKRASLVKTWRVTPTEPGQVMISTGSSTRVPLPDASVDYIFVDPPFGENIYYSDLDYLIEAWHGVRTNADEEAIVSRNKRAPRSRTGYRAIMEDCLREFYRVLKPGRWLTMEFSNSSNEVWLVIQAALAAAGFIVADTRILDKEQLSYRQVTAANAVKRDLVISAYRPASELEERFALTSGTEEGAWAFVREHLRHLPTLERAAGTLQVVRERLADRLYDRMVAYHVHKTATVPVTAAEFYAGLERRFPVRDDMYFLPDQVEVYERARVTGKRAQETALLVSNEATAIQWLRQHLRGRRRTYAEIQPDFFRESQAGVDGWEDLPDLLQLLRDNFLQDDEGRWYVPDPGKATDMEKLRERALLREFEQYPKGRGALARFRTEAVRAGFKDAWARRDFDTIVTVGNRLPVDLLAEDVALSRYLDNARRLKG